MLSIDPSSPFRGGALLGDRIRLTDHFLDPGVFIRSMATRGALGGLAEAALQAALLMDAAGRDDVFLETVGVGQAEVDVIDHADSIVLVLIPGSGDSIQALKAGVMEIPDIIVVNKADHPLTDTMVREIRGVLSLAPAEGGWNGADRQDRGGAGARAWTSSAQTACRAPRASSSRAGCSPSAAGATCCNEVLGLATARLSRLRRAQLEVRALDEVARRLDPASARARCSTRRRRAATPRTRRGAAPAAVRMHGRLRAPALVYDGLRSASGCAAPRGAPSRTSVRAATDASVGRECAAPSRGAPRAPRIRPASSKPQFSAPARQLHNEQRTACDRRADRQDVRPARALDRKSAHGRPTTAHPSPPSAASDEPDAPEQRERSERPPDARRVPQPPRHERHRARQRDDQRLALQRARA